MGLMKGLAAKSASLEARRESMQITRSEFLHEFFSVCMLGGLYWGVFMFITFSVLGTAIVYFVIPGGTQFGLVPAIVKVVSVAAVVSAVGGLAWATLFFLTMTVISRRHWRTLPRQL